MAEEKKGHWGVFTRGHEWYDSFPGEGVDVPLEGLAVTVRGVRRHVPKNMGWAFGEDDGDGAGIFYSANREDAVKIATLLLRCAPCTEGDVAITIKRISAPDGTRVDVLYREGWENGETPETPVVASADVHAFLGLD